VEEQPRDALREAVGQVPLRAQQRVQRDLHGWARRRNVEEAERWILRWWAGGRAAG
jgi:hypothetical protein